MWKSLISPLPCLDTTSACIQALQNLAVANSPINKKIDTSITTIEEKIEEAIATNQISIQLAVFEPALQYFLKQEQVTIPAQNNQPARTEIRGGLINNVLSLFSEPMRVVNDLLAVIGIPLLRGTSGGNDAQRAASIAISDLRLKVEELRKSKEEIALKTRDAVLFSVLEFDTRAREFQIQQAVSRREIQRFELFKVGYRFGQSSTEAYLSQQSALDKQKASVLREWSQMRSQLEKVKLLVLARISEDE